jgi:hypothetical protein
MKKLERLNTKLFSSLSNSVIDSLATLQGGTYEEWTSNDKKKTCDTETHTGQEGCNGDNTDKDCDVTTTDCSQDHAIAFDPNSLDSVASVVSTSVAY